MVKRVNDLLYEFEKWTMITLASVAASLTIGIVLMQYGHGQESWNTTKLAENSSRPVLTLGQFSGLHNHVKALEALLNYCFEHASDSANPIQDLVDKGLIPQGFSGKPCGEIRLDLHQAKIQPAYCDLLQHNFMTVFDSIFMQQYATPIMSLYVISKFKRQEYGMSTGYGLPLLKSKIRISPAIY